jgi:hypothetical protein
MTRNTTDEVSRCSLVGALIALVRVKAEQHGLNKARTEALELERNLVRVRQQVCDGAVGALAERQRDREMACTTARENHNCIV